MLGEIIMELGIWFEDLTAEPDRVFCSDAAPAKGMPEEWFDSVLGIARAKQKRFVTPGVLSGVRVEVPLESYCQFESVLRSVCHRLGSNPWIRDLSEPDYLAYWSSGRSITASRDPAR